MPLFRITDKHFVELTLVRNIMVLHDGDKVKVKANGTKGEWSSSTFDMTKPSDKESYEDVMKRLKEISL